MIVPRRQISVLGVSKEIQADEAGARELFQSGLDISGVDARMVGEHERPELLGISHHTPLVVSLGDEADPQAVLPIAERPDLPVLLVLRLEATDSWHADSSPGLLQVQVATGHRGSSRDRYPGGRAAGPAPVAYLTAYGIRRRLRNGFPRLYYCPHTVRRLAW